MVCPTDAPPDNSLEQLSVNIFTFIELGTNRGQITLCLLYTSIEMTEKQISGRNISLNIDYEDILAADSFHADLLEEE